MINIERAFPFLQVATAVAPLGAAMLLRLAAGPSRFTGILLSLASTWFAVNVLLSPFTSVTRIDTWLR